ncbi:glucose-6-phosphate isomerase [Parasutterella excrementihominis]|uniref:glucose-6-phosphate isomerase n=1 Tax=Parasutterella excrementihominis TaxID=487175 RepID=UPI002432DA18|nr:glucose-6-phosphate isomerase [Parasutterella excrementihominis]
MKDSIVTALGINLDISKQRISPKDFYKLVEFAQKKKIVESFVSMRHGALVNPTEGRQALHTSLRDPSTDAPYAQRVHNTLNRICKFANEVNNSKWLGCSGETITDIINIGIGGSDMGPKAVYNALRPSDPKLRVHFLASADGVSLDRVTAGLDPYRTLVVVSSKSFSTLETLSNTREIFVWLENAGIKKADYKQHVIAVSANEEAPNLLGIPEANFFPIWDWVGGRFSVWGAIGLPVAVALGEDVFRRFLTGAHLMDEHSVSAPIQYNLPALLSILSYWNKEKEEVSSYCFLPYDERLSTLVFWLQQLEMESLGKNKTLEGGPVLEKTCIPVWGGHGNESQHSFYQFLRQGTAKTALDICWCKRPGHSHDELHRILIANAKVQTEALMTRDKDDEYFNVANTIVLDELTPERLGSLMAMYENKTVMLGSLLGINPFDQQGVELGKILAKRLL